MEMSIARRLGGTLVVHSPPVPTRHHRIQVTEDAELSAALRAAGPHLPPGLPRAKQIRELAIAGARHLAGDWKSDEERQKLLEELAQTFDEPGKAGIDWDLLREGKSRAWPIR
jgi:hypothetical protein